MYYTTLVVSTTKTHEFVPLKRLEFVMAAEQAFRRLVGDRQRLRRDRAALRQPSDVTRLYLRAGNDSFTGAGAACQLW